MMQYVDRIEDQNVKLKCFHAKEPIPLSEDEKQLIAKHIRDGKTKGEITTSFNRNLYVIDWSL